MVVMMVMMLLVVMVVEMVVVLVMVVMVVVMVDEVLRLPRYLHIKIHIAQPCQGISQQQHFLTQHQDAKTRLSLETSSDF